MKKINRSISSGSFLKRMRTGQSINRSIDRSINRLLLIRRINIPHRSCHFATVDCADQSPCAEPHDNSHSSKQYPFDHAAVDWPAWINTPSGPASQRAQTVLADQRHTTDPAPHSLSHNHVKPPGFYWYPSRDWAGPVWAVGRENPPEREWRRPVGVGATREVIGSALLVTLTVDQSIYHGGFFGLES